MKKIYRLLLLFLLCSCTSTKSVLEIDNRNYRYFIDYESGSLVIIDNMDNIYKSIGVKNYNIVYNGSSTYRGYLYQYGDYYILSVG